MQTFKINEYMEIVCDSKKTRNGFKHEATLLLSGIESGEVKENYLNRTWERFEYDTVIEKLADIARDGDVQIIRDFVKNRVSDRGTDNLKRVAVVAGLGEIFGKNQKEKNDWKARMLKAGLEGRGLIMPDNWDELSEADKEARLDGAIGQLK